MEPRVGTGVFIFREKKLLLGQRQGSHGEGSWCLPGGHLEFGESFNECVSRETKEECGVDITNIQFLTATNDIFPSEKKHYVTLFFSAETSDEPEDQPGESMHSWGWFSLEKLPQPLFRPLETLIENFRNNKEKLFISTE